MRVFGLLGVSILIASATADAETIRYQYDALGRLVQVTHDAPAKPTVIATYEYDKADNRQRVSVAQLRSVAAWRAGDINGDGRDDLLWRNDNGTLTNWLATSGGSYFVNDAVALSQVSTDWQVIGTGDVNGDGRDDLIWRQDLGAVAVWLGSTNGGYSVVTPTIPSALNQNVFGVADINGDHRVDLLWRSDSGTISTWLGTSAGGFTDNSPNSTYTVPLDWQIVQVGDFDGDGRSDILWRNISGLFCDWLGNAAGGFNDNYANSAAQVSNDWQIAGVGDFNGDGKSDIFWRHSSGDASYWTAASNGSGSFAPNPAGAYYTVGLDWTVVLIGDPDADGRDDVFWRNRSGELMRWKANLAGLFDNVVITSQVGNEWTVEPRRK